MPRNSAIKSKNITKKINQKENIAMKYIKKLIEKTYN